MINKFARFFSIQQNINKLKIYCVFLSILFTLTSVGAIFYFVNDNIISQIKSEMEKKNVILGRAILGPISKALNLGIPYQKLQGVEDYFQTFMEDSSDLFYLVLADTSGNILYKSFSLDPFDFGKIEKEIRTSPLNNKFAPPILSSIQRSQLVIHTDNGIPGILHIGINSSHLYRTLSEILIDFAVLVFVSIVLSIQLLRFLLNARIYYPVEIFSSFKNPLAEEEKNFLMTGDDEIGVLLKYYFKTSQYLKNLYTDIKDRFSVLEIYHEKSEGVINIRTTLKSLEKMLEVEKSQVDGYEALSTFNMVRIPLFLLMMTECFSLSFIPLFAHSLLPRAHVSFHEFTVALPLVAFMVGWAWSPPLVILIQAWIRRRSVLFLGSLCCIFLGLIGASMASTLSDLILCRGLTGMGHGGFLILYCNATLSGSSVHTRKNILFSLFMDSHIAMICGAVIGGLIAEAIGYEATFKLSAFVSLLAGLYLMRVRGYQGASVVFTARSFLHQVGSLLKNSKFMALMFFVSLPVRIFMSALVYFVTPLYLDFLGVKLSQIGHSIMLYGLCIVVFASIGKLSSFLIERKNALFFIYMGGIFLVCALFTLLLEGGHLSIIIAVFFVGITFAFVFSGRMILYPQLCLRKSDNVSPVILAAVSYFFDFQGFALGPLLAGLLIPFYGYVKTLIILGGGCLFMNLVFILYIYPRLFFKKSLETSDAPLSP